MPRAMRVCTTPGCPEITAGGKCTECKAKAEAIRGSAARRGYGGSHWQARRHACLTGRCKCPATPCQHGPLCVCTDQGHGHDGRQCMAPADTADHWPRSRRELISAGVADPDAVEHLRSLDKRCHDKHTAFAQPGGWHASQSR